jgi:hypothetical protein
MKSFLAEVELVSRGVLLELPAAGTFFGADRSK